MHTKLVNINDAVSITPHIVKAAAAVSSHGSGIIDYLAQLDLLKQPGHGCLEYG